MWNNCRWVPEPYCQTIPRDWPWRPNQKPIIICMWQRETKVIVSIVIVQPFWIHFPTKLHGGMLTSYIVKSCNMYVTLLRGVALNSFKLCVSSLLRNDFNFQVSIFLCVLCRVSKYVISHSIYKNILDEFFLQLQVGVQLAALLPRLQYSIEFMQTVSNSCRRQKAWKKTSLLEILLWKWYVLLKW